MKGLSISSILILLTALFIVSCSGTDSVSENQSLNINEKDSAYFISKTDDTVFTGTPFKIEGKLRDTNVYFLNQTHFGDATYSIAEIPRYESAYTPIVDVFPLHFDSMPVTIPGKDTLLPFEYVAVQPDKLILKNSASINAGSLRHKENARYDLQYLNAEAGLVSGYIYSLLFDKKGFLWIGSERGLSRYDGITLVHYDSNSGLPDNKVTSLFEDSKGNLWIGTQYGGLAKYNGTTIEIYNRENGLPANYIGGFTEDKSGSIWAAIWGGGVVKISGDSLAVLGREHGLRELRVTDVEADRDGNIWIATNGWGLFIFDGIHLKHHGNKFGYNDGYLLSITRDSQNRMWMGNWNTFVWIENDSVYTMRNVERGAPGIPTGNIFEDSRKNIWFASGSGIAMWDGTKIHMIDEDDGLPSKSATSIHEDPAGNIWIGTAGGGIARYNPNSFQYFDKSAGLPDNVVHAMIETKSGLIAMASDGGVVFFNDTSVNRLFVNDEVIPFAGTIYEIFETKDSALWFSQLNGAVYRLKGDSIKHIANHQGMHDHNITAIAQLESGEMWFGAWNVGLSKMNNKGQFTVYNAGSGLMNFIITDLIVDQKQNLWIATDGEGITVFDGEYFTHLTTNEGLASDHVNALYADHNGTIWVLTNKGISLVNNRKISSFQNNNLLPDINAVSMTEDHDQNIWIMTADGILFLQKKENIPDGIFNPDNYTMKIFNHFDGLLSTDFIPRSVLVDSENRIWLGTGKGVIMKNLTTFDLTPQKPDVRIETIKLNGNFIDYNHLDNRDYDSLFPGFYKTRQDISAPAAFANIPSTLVLPSDINHLTFIFSTCGWYTDKTQFIYRLVGLDETWSNPTKENWAEYRNLSYGKYTFEVKTLGESNTESDVLKYEFEILPPWYHTWWARLIMLLMLLVVLRFIIQSRTKQLLKKQAMLEQKVMERTAQLDEKNQELQLQNSIIEEQRIEAEMRKEKIEKQHLLLEETHKEIRDSINYAKRIQEAILPPKSIIDKLLPDNFILYKPKDVVAGDFYWIHEANHTVFFASADCTGHGVPGAMVSVVCYNALNRAVREFSLTSPEKILDKTREIVLETFQQNSSQVNDGMDISLIALKRSETNATLLYSGANNPVCIVREGKLIELESDKQPVGNYKDAKPFTLKTLEMHKQDVIYLFTDGYADQFGGPKGKKLKSKVLKEMLLSVSMLDIAEQKNKLHDYLDQWKGDLEQLDDISVFGFKV